ncbi:tyrosine-type recombinase/integrase [Nostoc ellipsosporum NOK]|nr:tyrosine-type recombinase/integrase [Nostoc ellipsosporum NOK]
MLLLPNNCKCSGTAGDPKKGIPDQLAVSPKNWRSERASVAKAWYIHYRFYDPSPEFKQRWPKGKPVLIKSGINEFKTARERREATQVIMEETLHMLKVEGFNPWTGASVRESETGELITKETSIIEALKYAQERVQVCAADIKSVMKHTIPAIEACRWQYLPVSQFTKRHGRILLDKIGQMKLAAPAPTKKGQKPQQWTNNTFNYYRAHLMILFKYLDEYDVVEGNPIEKIKKQDYSTPPRDILTLEERVIVDRFLKEKHYTFWRFMQVFFHSGARESEMMRLQAKDVDIQKQRFRVSIKKGRTQKWVWKTIKNSAVLLWKEVLQDAFPEDYVFSKKFIPGPTPMSPRSVTQRWRRTVKKPKESGGLGINKDFYSLKHLNLDETSAALGVEAAQKIADHSTPLITLRHYLPGEENRQHERIKRIGNSFS